MNSPAIKLTTGQMSALRDLKRGGEFCPSRERRPSFHQLIDHGLARWTGYGLGGEGFVITDLGREALRHEQ